MKLNCQKVDENAVVPKYANKDDAGADLYSVENKILQPGERCLINTGLIVEVPKNHVLDVRPRSGLALKKGVTVLNTPGTVDSGYRGLLGAILINHGEEPFEIKIGDKIAQAVIVPIVTPEWEEVDNIDKNTDRGEGGFGSTGVSTKV